MKTTHEPYVARLERELMVGSGRWIANFKESERRFRLSDIEFDAFIKGNTRVKGFLLSRFFNFLLNPNYEVACFITCREAEGLTRKRFHHYLVTLKTWMEQNNVKWSWLFFFMEGLSEEVKARVQEVEDPNLGIVAIDPAKHEFVNNNTYLGRQARRYAKF